MNIEFLILGGYGIYVWPAFIIAFVTCSYFYFKTKAELEKQEKIYLNEFKFLQSEKVKLVKRNKTIKIAASIN